MSSVSVHFKHTLLTQPDQTTSPGGRLDPVPPSPSLSSPPSHASLSLPLLPHHSNPPFSSAASRLPSLPHYPPPPSSSTTIHTTFPPLNLSSFSSSSFSYLHHILVPQPSTTPAEFPPLVLPFSCSFILLSVSPTSITAIAPVRDCIHSLLFRIIIVRYDRMERWVAVVSCADFVYFLWILLFFM